LNVLDRRLVEDVANRLGTDAGLVEKDWYVVRAIGVLADFDHGEVKPAFSGGTSLSKGWGLIKRFSEDIDFKVDIPAEASHAKDKRRRREYREQILSALQAVEFVLDGEVIKADEGRFFGANFTYPTNFAAGKGLRPHLKVEMTMTGPALATVNKPIRSLIGEAQGKAPEVESFPCVDAVETAADKLSALAWRVCTRQQGSEKDDPTIIRHLHDLAALEAHVATAPQFNSLVQNAAADDAGRGGGSAPADAADRLAMMLGRLQSEPFWALEYNEFVRQLSFASPDETIGFDRALAATCRLCTIVAQAAFGPS